MYTYLYLFMFYLYVLCRFVCFFIYMLVSQLHIILWLPERSLLKDFEVILCSVFWFLTFFIPKLLSNYNTCKFYDSVI